MKRLFDKYFHAHRAYQRKLSNSQTIKQAEEQYEEHAVSYRNFTDKIAEWINLKDPRLDNISPNDSASQVGSKVSSSRQSVRSSVRSELQAKEATRMAELMVQAKSLEIQQRLEQEKLRLQQEETRVALEMEIAKTAAKENALAALQISQPPTPNIIEDTGVFKGSLEHQTPIPRSTGRKLPQIPSINKTEEGPSVKKQVRQHYRLERHHESERALPVTSTLETMLRLQEQQNDLNIQQNEIMKGFSLQHRKSTLPQQRVPVFKGNPTEYNNFIREFENIIEAKVVNASERLYYLEQFTAGQVRELVKSCYHMPPGRGYQEARALLKRNYGNEYKIAAAYMDKVLKWPELKPEDNLNLHRFSILLVCCKNVMDGNELMTKFDNPENIHQIVQKLHLV